MRDARGDHPTSTQVYKQHLFRKFQVLVAHRSSLIAHRSSFIVPPVLWRVSPWVMTSSAIASSTRSILYKVHSFASRDDDESCTHSQVTTKTSNVVSVVVWKFRFLIPRFESQLIGPPASNVEFQTCSSSFTHSVSNSQHHDGFSKQQQP
jgi:hypothetical protein